MDALLGIVVRLEQSFLEHSSAASLNIQILRLQNHVAF